MRVKKKLYSIQSSFIHVNIVDEFESVFSLPCVSFSAWCVVELVFFCGVCVRVFNSKSFHISSFDCVCVCVNFSPIIFIWVFPLILENIHWIYGITCVSLNIFGAISDYPEYCLASFANISNKTQLFSSFPVYFVIVLVNFPNLSGFPWNRCVKPISPHSSESLCAV